MSGRFWVQHIIRSRVLSGHVAEAAWIVGATSFARSAVRHRCAPFSEGSEPLCFSVELAVKLRNGCRELAAGFVAQQSSPPLSTFLSNSDDISHDKRIAGLTEVGTWSSCNDSALQLSLLFFRPMVYIGAAAIIYIYIF